jgi:adenylate cyclase
MADEALRAPDDNSEEWRRILTGDDPRLPNIRRGWRLLPSSPRCKMCAAPFRGVGRLLTKAMMHGASEGNPLMCNRGPG